MKRTRSRTFIINTAITAASIIIALALVEGILRLRFGGPPSRHGEWIDLKRAGFRYGKVRVERDPLSLRIVGIGDSFAFGVVQPTFNYHHVLQRLLSGTLGRPIEVINLGKPSVGPGGELAILEELGLRLSPDIVLWTFFMGNDFTDDQPVVRYSLREVLGTRHWENSKGKAGSAHSFGRLRITGYFRFLYTYAKNIGIPGVGRENSVSLPQETFLNMEIRRIAGLLNDRQIRRTFRTKVEPRLRSAFGLCKSRNIPFVLAIAPDRAEVEADLGRTILSSLIDDGKLRNIEPGILQNSLQTGNFGPLTLAHDLLAQLESRPDICVIDLTEAFRAESQPLYIKRDSHWNRKGNQLAAEIISRGIEEVLKE